MIAAILGSFGAETLRVSVPQAELARVLHRPESTPDEVRQAARQLVSSPLTRYSARRDLFMAEATARVHDETREHAESSRLKYLERASAKEPLSDWHRLNFARAAKDDASRAEEIDSSWDILSKSHSAEPLVQEQLAFRRVDKGELEKALEQFRRMLEATPERTDDVLSQLLARNVSLKEAWNVVPNSPIALARLYEMSERETVIGLRKEIEVRLTQLDPRASNSGVATWTPDDWAALGMLSQGFERWDEAAHAWQQAVTMEPSRRDWKYSLARVRFEQKEFEECEETLAELLMSKLSPDMLSQVKALQDQLISARAEQAMPGGVPLTPATLRAN
jgi:tetratricopeptide (TPR) repeat protein